MTDNEVRAALLALLILLVPLVGKFLAALMQYQTAILEKMLNEMKEEMRDRKERQIEIGETIERIADKQNEGQNGNDKDVR